MEAELGEDDPSGEPSPEQAVSTKSNAPRHINARLRLTTSAYDPATARRYAAGVSEGRGADPALSDPYALARRAADQLRTRTGINTYEAFVILGSGWSAAADSFGDPVVMTMESLPGFIAPVAEGHVGEIRSVGIEGHPVLVFAGRTHLYEGHGPAAVAHGVRTAAAAGCRLAVLTNANGSLREDWALGSGVLIRDHLNLSMTSPLVGARFVDLTDTWSTRLRRIAQQANPELREGVYAMLPGPQFETWAEALALRKLGADILGMSTVLEAIAARELNVELLGVSVVTAIEGSPEGIDPQQVVAIGADSAKTLAPMIATVIREGLA
jgi:purine-nucleoside phosphorylase